MLVLHIDLVDKLVKHAYDRHCTIYFHLNCFSQTHHMRENNCYNKLYNYTNVGHAATRYSCSTFKASSFNFQLSTFNLQRTASRLDGNLESAPAVHLV